MKDKGNLLKKLILFYVHQRREKTFWPRNDEILSDRRNTLTFVTGAKRKTWAKWNELWRRLEFLAKFSTPLNPRKRLCTQSLNSIFFKHNRAIQFRRKIVWSLVNLIKVFRAVIRSRHYKRLINASFFSLRWKRASIKVNDANLDWKEETCWWDLQEVKKLRRKSEMKEKALE